MLNYNDKYAHLYEKGLYIPPSVIRKLEMETPNPGETFGETDISRKFNINSYTNQSTIDRFIKYKLSNRDVYSDMKNKAMYSLNKDVQKHSSLNSL